jgi:hypothetical protein
MRRMRASHSPAGPRNRKSAEPELVVTHILEHAPSSAPSFCRLPVRPADVDRITRRASRDQFRRRGVRARSSDRSPATHHHRGGNWTSPRPITRRRRRCRRRVWKPRRGRAQGQGSAAPRWELVAERP